MNVDTSRTSQVDPVKAFAASARPGAEVPAVAAPRSEDRVEFSFPASPPPEVMQEVAEASERAAELADNGRELHFHFDEEARRVIVEVRDLNGEVLRTIPPSHALAAVSGEMEV